MATKVAQMTTDELSALIGSVVEEKLIELFGDPDDGLVMKKGLRNRLVRQMQATAKGERGESLEVVAKKLGLDVHSIGHRRSIYRRR